MARTVPKVQTDEDRGAAKDGLAPGEERPLRVNEVGIARLRERLAAANRDNPDFEAQFQRLMGVVSRALEKLRTGFADEIELVVATGAWARAGIDLRNLFDSDDIVLEVVVRAAELDVNFAVQLSEALFAETHNGDFFLQVTMMPLHLRERSLALPWNQGRADALGIPLLARA